MQNIPLILYLGKNLSEYGQQTADHCTLTTLVNTNFPIEQLAGHKDSCKLKPARLLKYHGSYKRIRIIDTAGQPHCAQIILLEGLSKEIEQILIEAFWNILLAPDQNNWEAGLAELESWEDFQHPNFFRSFSHRDNAPSTFV